MDLRPRGVDNAPELTVGDDALMESLIKIIPSNSPSAALGIQDCNKLLRLVQPKVKACLHDIWMAEIIPQGDGVFEQGQRLVTGFLRLPCNALAAFVS